jgi:hypothetical protein
MNTKPIPKEKFLELENASLKLHIMRRNVQDMLKNVKDLEAKFQEIGEKLLESESLSKDQWAIDLDKGQFVEKVT